MRKTILTMAIAMIPLLSFSQETLDLDGLRKIAEEGFQRSGIDDISYMIVDKAGPRLTNSPGYQRAAELTSQAMKDWGLQNVHQEAWGEFGRGWELNKSYIAMTKPYYIPFIAIPNAWSGSTQGLISGDIQFVDISSEEDFDKYRGKLKGKIVAFDPNPAYVRSKGDQSPTFVPDAARFTASELEEMTDPLEEGEAFNAQRLMAYAARKAFSKKLDAFLAEEEVALSIHGAVGKHGTLFTGRRQDAWEPQAPKNLADINLAPEHYNLLKRLKENGEEVEIEVEIKTTFQEEDFNGYNVIGEIPGTDPNLKSEIVMLGAHLDSWHGATGATDNGAGSIVMMEAIRILKASGVQPKRTVRIALWGGEEQGLNGSKGYVKEHFGDSETMTLKDEYEKLSGYFNIDNGTGRIRGIYLQGNEKVRPIFDQWFEPLDSLIDNRTITIRNTGGTDHLSFDRIGLPGFQFIQDPVEYSTRTHHTNMDTRERLIVEDLQQMAVIVASFVYNTAQREEKLPREETEALISR